MEQLQIAEAKLKAAHDIREAAYAAEIKKLDDAKKKLFDRLHNLDEQKKKIAAENGSAIVSDDDVIEVNAGGKLIAAKRGTLCQIKGTRFEGLFSGRWDKKLQRDSSGRIFLDVNSDCFQAIVDWLNELAISSEDNRPSQPTASDKEFRDILSCHMMLFGLDNLKEKEKTDRIPKKIIFAVKKFTKEINEAINEKWKCLHVLEAQIDSLEASFTDEEDFIDSFATGEKKDVITLNVSGTIMTTTRATLMFVEDSVLAQQFDDSKWTVQDSSSKRGVKEWTSTEVSEWVDEIEGIKKGVSEIFKKSKINGLELLALNEYGLEKIGVSRPATICLLVKATTRETNSGEINSGRIHSHRV